MAAPLYARLVWAVFSALNRRRVWHRLPTVLAAMNLIAIRSEMRERNLYDTETAPLAPKPAPGFDLRRCRTADGSFNDLAEPWMGMTDARFGRNVPLPETRQRIRAKSCPSTAAGRSRSSAEPRATRTRSS